ncbi:VIT family protein [Croceicoccus sp. BE223]|uniref:VIT1/CCC1 transporter family protein n=1 Tax=Croceicoccus sp. BE223 TaxID=2817716 RepID=UPI002865BA26|nr:VIT family protein [Croceicoccus sp. BE223]MDR7103448.1 VIT1/CCC1 family predicted Fe2+/Mn2+ transporter [Croceicoccus sp. BE223]
MSRLHVHNEAHATSRIGWLRAAVMGANDGIVSTASLIVGVAAAESSKSGILVAGVAALIAGAMSMAAGEYVSVSSQSDTENADLSRERRELAEQPDAELDELTRTYVERGVAEDLARTVAKQMTEHDALGTHARDELGISEITTARPLQAAAASALTFTIGAAAPLLVVPVAPASMLIPAVAVVSIVCLAVLGALGAKAGGAPLMPAVVRVSVWGAIAMGVTAAVGSAFGAVVG